MTETIRGDKEAEVETEAVRDAVDGMTGNIKKNQAVEDNYFNVFAVYLINIFYSQRVLLNTILLYQVKWRYVILRDIWQHPTLNSKVMFLTLARVAKCDD